VDNQTDAAALKPRNRRRRRWKCGPVQRFERGT